MTDQPLTAEAVESLFQKVLFQESEPLKDAVVVNAVRCSFGFHPMRIKDAAVEIRAMLEQLPPQFSKSGGGGWTFLNASEDKNGRQWGDHTHINILFAMAIAAGIGEWGCARELWATLPGEIPYFVWNDTKH